jgi:hypothetical protein
MNKLRMRVEDLLRSLSVRLDLIWPRLYEPLATRKIYWVGEIADRNAPTRSEIDNGTDLTNAVLGYDGFTKDALPGEPTVEFRRAKGEPSAVLQLLTLNQAGYIIMLPEGDVPYRGDSRTMHIYPVQVIGTLQAATDRVSFLVTAPPVIGVAVPDVPNERPTRRELRRGRWQSLRESRYPRRSAS